MGAKNITSNITFIGSGISTSFSIISFLDLISNETHHNSKISINIIEKYSEFNLGIPYGSRSGFSPLLITSLKNFLIEPERSLFIKWLNNNKTWLLKEFEKEGGVLSKKWMINNEASIKNNEWEDLFIPRRFFGCYIDLKVTNKIKEVTEKGLIDVNFVNGEVVDIEKSKNYYKILLKDHSEIDSKKVILSAGSLPKQNLWGNKDFIEDKNLMFINNPYKPNLGVVLNKMDDFIRNRASKTTKILIVGANASALELIYKINDFSKEKYTNAHFTFLSTQGKIPDASIDLERQKLFSPSHLNELIKNKNLTAKLIAEATYKDLDVADKINLGAASTVDIVSRSFGVLLENLSSKELEVFACKYGNEIGKRQRCAGLHYTNVIDALEKQNKFEHIAGRFNSLSHDKANGDYRLKYLDTTTQKEKTHEEPFHIIINCVGSKTLKDKDIPTLHQNLIKKKYCIPNESTIGFHVNEYLEASENLHIMGPMLAGNVINNKAVWHVEHCGRIIGISKILSKIIYKDVFRNKGYSTKNYALEVISLDNASSIKKYSHLLKESWGNNIYYSFHHLNYFQNKTSCLKYFLFKINDTNQILMPLILRQIESTKTESNYFDSITPYGYSGPLYNREVNELELKVFWEHVDNWYKENNVISEFIRFSLNKNFKDYNGLLIPSLKNIKGTLSDEFEKQWKTFLPKVRNNYRRAVSFNLTAKIYSNSDINEDIIKVFYEIYTNTMIRNNANSVYFFSLDYFKNLILNNLSEFSIVMVYLGEIAISTELIIKKNTTIFAFLGGTDANYYKYRPNDFLRVETIKWAIKNNLKHYVLGGGIKDFDSLYKSKKAFFPKDKDITFYTGRKIVNNKIYHELCENHVEDYTNIRKEELKNYFFPLYRF